MINVVKVDTNYTNVHIDQEGDILNEIKNLLFGSKGEN